MRMIEESCSEQTSYSSTEETSAKWIAYDKIVEEEGGRHNIANIKAVCVGANRDD